MEGLGCMCKIDYRAIEVKVALLLYLEKNSDSEKKQ